MELNVDEKGSLGLLALGDLGLDIWRAIKERKPIPQPKAPTSNKSTHKNRVVLIGWDSADWNMINPLMEQGHMPTLKAFLEGGSHGNIRTMDPSFSPMLWTSIATGKYADEHGILGFVEPNADGNDIQPVQSTSRKCHALWNILGSQGLRSNVIGWWPSHPVEPINGVMVSNHFHNLKRYRKNKGHIDERSIHPPEILDKIKDYRIFTKELTAAHIFPFVPQANKVDQKTDNRLARLGDAIAQSATMHATTTWLMQNTDWDLTAVYFNELDQVSHHFGIFTAPKADKVPQDLFDVYKEVVPSMYRFYDMMLHRILELAGDDTNVIIVSDHGFKLGKEKLVHLPKLPAAIALEHNQYGIIAAKGPDFAANQKIFDAELLDITPTILQLFDLPIGQDMHGKILQTAPKEQKTLPAIDSWENEPGEFGRHDESIIVDPIEAKKALDQLIALGYVEELGDDKEEQLAKVTRDLEHNLSLVYRDQGKLKESVELLENLYAQDKVDPRFSSDLISAYTQLKQFDKAMSVLNNFRKFDVSKSFNFDQMEARIHLASGDFESGERKLLDIYGHDPENITIVAELGVMYAHHGHYRKAEKHLKRAVALRRNDAALHYNLGIALFKQGHDQEALEQFLATLELRTNFPAAHYYIGSIFVKGADYPNAIQAFDNCLALNPGINRARNALMNIYQFYLPDETKYLSHKEAFNNIRREEIIVVTGLPRSGTSMIMQMLKKGGIEIFADDVRCSDENNPKGYLEAEVVKGIKRDDGWLDQTVGKAVKIVIPLVSGLRLNFNYKIIWVERNISEVMMSQEEMLSRTNPTHKKTLNLAVQNQYLKMLTQAKKFFQDKNNISVLKLKHDEVIKDPEQTATSIYEFLGGRGDVSRMASAVDPKLHRVQIENEITL